MSRLKAILTRRRRGAMGLEAILIFPPMLILFGAVSQVMILAQQRTYVEMAAYAAARSAMVHRCPEPAVMEALSSPFAALAKYNCTDDASKQRKIEDAARWTLVAASPTSEFAKGRGCPNIVAGLQIARASGKLNGLDDALTNAICYAYERENVTVTADWDLSTITRIVGADSIPMRAKVRYRAQLSTPFRRFIYDEKRGDGTYWKWVEAEVVLQ